MRESRNIIPQSGSPLQMGHGLHLSQIERANLLSEIKQSRKSKEKLNRKSGLFQQMAVRRDNLRLCSMGLQILSGRQIANKLYFLRKLDRLMKKMRMERHCQKYVSLIDYGTALMASALSMKDAIIFS